MWDEEYNERHVSSLKKINELDYFKQIIEKLKTEYQDMYNHLIQLIPGQKLNRLQILLDASIGLPEK